MLPPFARRTAGLVPATIRPVIDEQQLLAAWRDGDEDAGEVLFERYYESLSRFFRSKAGEQAPDLIQRTFLVLVETQSRIREGTTFQAYLFGVARNILLEHYRGKRRDGERFDPAERSVEDFGPTPTTLIAQVQETQLLLQALRKIPVESQMILELYYWENMTAKDIGDVLEIPEGTARTRIRRAKQLLEAALAALAASPALLNSTVSDLESWAVKLRDALKLKK
mgnify:CR=1 FL=1